MPPVTTSPQNKSKKGSVGPLFGIVIIMALLVFGAFYTWGAHLNKESETAQAVSYIPSGTTTLPDITR